MMKSVILNSPLAKIPPKTFLNFAIRKSLKKLKEPSETKREIEKLFNEGGAWGRGLSLDIVGVGTYHFICNGNMEFYWLKDSPLVPFPKKVGNRDIEELVRIQKTGEFANCELILPYKIFLLILGKERGPRDAVNKGEATVKDYDGMGWLYHATVLMKFFDNLRSSVGL